MPDSSLKQTLTDAMKDAMRAQDKARLGTLRLALAEIKKEELAERAKPKDGKDSQGVQDAQGAQKDAQLNDSRIISLLDKMVKQRRESIKQYEAGKRKDLADVEKAEIEVLQEFLPQQLSADEVAALIKQAVAASGAKAMQDMGKVMAALKPQLAGRADMGLVSQLVKKALS